MPSSPSEWDAKHSLAANEVAAEAPAGILTELWSLLPAGPVLDLACGRGRNALFLAGQGTGQGAGDGAEHGRHVTAVDWSGAALDILEERAKAQNIAVRRIQRIDEMKTPARAGIDLLQVDLEAAALPPNRYSVILCVRYLQRSLFPQISRALRPGGMLLFETYTRAQLDFSGGPRDPAHLLNPGELRRVFPELETVFYRELRAGQGIASLAAQKPRSENRHQNAA